MAQLVKLLVAMDLFPTLSELIKAPLPKDRVYDGVSLMPLFSGGSIDRSENQPFFYYKCENLQAVRVGDWKLHLPRTKQQIPFWAQKRQKPIKTPRLYNLKTDIAEKNDVAAKNPERVSELLAIAETARLRLGEFKSRGSEQRATGTLFPEVPILSNQSQDWDALPDSVKGRGKTEFKPAHANKKKRKKKN